MRFKATILVLIATLLLFTACKPETVPEYQIVIETIPNHLLDIIEIMQGKSGVYIFNADKFATDKDTYMLISHGNKDNQMVNIDSMEFNRDKILEVQLKETLASMPRAYTVVKFLDYNREISVKNLDGKWPIIDTQMMKFTSRGTIVKHKNKEVQIKIDSNIVTINIATELANKLASTNKVFQENEDIVVEYKLIDHNLEATNILTVTDSGEAQGEFVGYIDSQSIEAKVDGTAKAYRLSQAAKLWLEENDLKSSDTISFEYYIVGESSYISSFK